MATTEENLTYEAVLEKDGVKVSKSPWGADDEIGRLNWITPESQKEILERLDGTKVFDLSVDYFIGMPSWSAAGDPKFDMWMTHTPQGSINDNLSGAGPEVHEKYSYCGDSIALYTHCGTHMDTLNHLGFFGCFWNGWTAEKDLGSRHWMVGGTEKYPNDHRARSPPRHRRAARRRLPARHLRGDSPRISEGGGRAGRRAPSRRHRLPPLRPHDRVARLRRLSR